MSHCFAPGCSSGYLSTRRKNKKLRIKNPSIFSAPKDSEMLEIWRKVIPRKDRIITKHDKICELHFTEECIERTFVTKIFDGSISVIERERPTLKNGAIPTIFPNLPYELNLTEISKTNLPIHHIHKRMKKQKTENDSVCSDQNVIDDFQDEVQKEQFSYMQLVEHLDEVQHPNPSWSVSQYQDFVVYAKWDASSKSDRKVIIYEDLMSKVFLREIEIPSLRKQVHNVGSLSSLLLTIDKLVICEADESGYYI